MTSLGIPAFEGALLSTNLLVSTATSPTVLLVAPPSRAVFSLNVLRVTLVVAPLRLSMAPPGPVARLLRRVLCVTVRLRGPPPLKMAAPTVPVKFSAKRLSISAASPLLRSPPPSAVEVFLKKVAARGLSFPSLRSPPRLVAEEPLRRVRWSP
ncbi:hypothetical protein ACFYM0_33345 [Streptomyces sp. NPDC006487]|uniref:hypothetical protein n=1 Tax=Streptomyces sp. NPDC006487 TaxID=3364748 RepID=UPI0036813C45